MLKPPAEDTELTRPGNQRVRPSLSWRNARQALHTRVAAFLGFAVLLTAVFIKPLFSLAAGAIHSQLDSYIVLVPFVSGYLIYARRKQLPLCKMVARPEAGENRTNPHYDDNCNSAN
jgi:hypothetical protein